jgi:hypothetical protein
MKFWLKSVDLLSRYDNSESKFWKYLKLNIKLLLNFWQKENIKIIFLPIPSWKNKKIKQFGLWNESIEKLKTPPRKPNESRYGGNGKNKVTKKALEER